MDNRAFVNLVRDLENEIRKQADFFFQAMNETISAFQSIEIAKSKADLIKTFDTDIHKFYEHSQNDVNRYRGQLSDVSQVSHIDFGKNILTLKNEYASKLEIVLLKHHKNEKQSMSSINYNLSGDNNKINIDSNDYSINIQNSFRIFDELKKRAEDEKIDPALREEILNSISEMEKNIESEDFLKGYKKFIALTANHVSIFAQLLPALAQFLN
jgi:hypothetical protein